MTKKINNIAELDAEIARLKQRSAELKGALKEDVEGIKEQFTPAGLAINIISQWTGIKFTRELFTKEGFVGEAKFVIEQLILKAGDAIEQKAHGVVDKVFDRITAIIENFFERKKKHSRAEDYAAEE